jgi:hypothetical protein
MIQFAATIQKFEKKGEKTGWSYIHIPSKLAEQILPGNKKSFRVKGKLDDYEIKQVSMIPMGEGDFIIPINASMRKALRKQKGATIQVKIEVDQSPLKQSSDLFECLGEEPQALQKFTAMPKSHQNYFSKWIESAKTEPTKAKRIAMTIEAMIKGMDYGEMLRAEREKKDQFLK